MDFSIIFSPANLAALATLWALYRAGRRWVGRWSELMAVLVLGTSHGFWSHAVTADSAMVVLALLTVAWANLPPMLLSPHRRRRWLVFWGGIGLAALANADVDALITILPRITYPNLTKEECSRLELPDLIALAGKVIGFLSPKPAE